MIGPADALALRREYGEWKRAQRATPEARIRHRQEIKEELSRSLTWPDRDEAPEAIVRDLARMDDYPEPDESLGGISPWFKVEIKGLYHRGLEVVLKLAGVELSRNEARETDGVRAETVAIVGRIPFDSIVLIDWSGDEHYANPHIYCWFDQNDGPYESIEVYRLPNERGFWEPLKVKFKPRGYSKWRRWWSHRALKRAQLEFDREF
jgi:hypothetical protein